jgi:hypothetical protein
MSQTTSIAINLDGVVALALRLRATREQVTAEELVAALLRAALAPEIEEASGGRPLAAVVQEAFKITAAGATRNRRAGMTQPPIADAP